MQTNFKEVSELYHSYLESQNELYHFGIKGMKWGVRRFQNEDGTLTEEGKERYYEEIISKSFTSDNQFKGHKQAFKSTEIKNGVENIHNIDEKLTDNFQKVKKLHDAILAIDPYDYDVEKALLDEDGNEVEGPNGYIRPGLDRYRKDLKTAYLKETKNKDVEEALKNIKELVQEKKDATKNLVNNVMSSKYKNDYEAYLTTKRFVDLIIRDTGDKNGKAYNYVDLNYDTHQVPFEYGPVPTDYLDKIDKWYDLLAYYEE